jgi:hypothetical protein
LEEDDDGGVGTALLAEWRSDGRMDWIRAGVERYIRSAIGVRRRYLGGISNRSWCEPGRVLIDKEINTVRLE